MDLANLPIEPLEQTTLDGIFNVAADYYAAGALDDAMAILQMLTLLSPADDGVWRALAQCHDDLGQTTVADELRLIPGRIAEATC